MTFWVEIKVRKLEKSSKKKAAKKPILVLFAIVLNFFFSFFLLFSRFTYDPKNQGNDNYDHNYSEPGAGLKNISYQFATAKGKAKKKKSKN